MNNPAIHSIAFIMIYAFTIDRIVNILMFLLPFFWPPRADAHAERIERLIHYGLAGVLATIVVIIVKDLRVLTSLGFSVRPSWFDGLFTVMVLVGGADGFRGFLKSVGVEVKDKPVEVTGTLTLDDKEKQKSSTAGTS